MGFGDKEREHLRRNVRQVDFSVFDEVERCYAPRQALMGREHALALVRECWRVWEFSSEEVFPEHTLRRERDRLDSIDMLLAEIDRLRGLIKETFNDRSRADCQWCDGGPERINGRTAHAKDCPAFTPEGVVR